MNEESTPPIGNVNDNPEVNEELLRAAEGEFPHFTSTILWFFSPLLGLISIFTLDRTLGNSLSKIDKLLRKGADVNYKNKITGYTALINAAYYGHYEIAKYLIEHGARTDIKEYEGYNALTMAKYYLDKYTVSLGKESYKDEPSLKKRCQERVERYQKLVDYLQPLTP